MRVSTKQDPIPFTVDIGQRVGAYIRSFRLKFLPQGVLPVVLGTLVAWLKTGRFDWHFFLLAAVGSAFVQIGLTMLNDTLDYVYGTDRSTTEEKNPFSGGSGVLADGLLGASEMMSAILFFYAAAAVIGAYLTFQVGPGVFWMALLGLFLSIYYSVKPLRLAYRGVGELAMLIGYGPTITQGAYYVQTGRFSLVAGLVSLVPGLLMWSMILVNEIPDYAEDLRAHKLNLTVRLGPWRAHWLYIASLCVTYAFIIGGAIVDIFPVSSLLALLSLPVAVRSFQVAHLHYLTPRKMVAANRAMVITYSSTMILFCLGFWLSTLL